jgi:hypothetical protein
MMLTGGPCHLDQNWRRCSKRSSADESEEFGRRSRFLDRESRQSPKTRVKRGCVSGVRADRADPNSQCVHEVSLITVALCFLTARRALVPKRVSGCQTSASIKQPNRQTSYAEDKTDQYHSQKFSEPNKLADSRAFDQSFLGG